MSVTAPEAVRPATPTRSPLTANDRCDRCGAQAYVALVMGHKGGKGVHEAMKANSGVELLFCAHHNREHGPALLVQGAVVTRDETEKLKPTNRQQGVSY